MEDALIILLQALFELIFEIVLNVPIYFWSDSLGGPPWAQSPPLSTGSLTSGHGDGALWNSFWLFILGCAIGGISLFVHDRALISLPFLRIANIFYSPVISGLIAYLIACIRQQDKPARRFCYAFCFTLGLTIIRFTYAHH